MLGLQTNLANLKVVGTGIAVNPVNPQGSNNFSTNFTIPENGSTQVDVYADVGASIGTASTTLTVTGTTVSGNVSTTTAAVNGQNISISTGQLSTPTIVTSNTAVSQYVVGGTSPQIAEYNLVSTSSPATVQELQFTVSGSQSGTVSAVTLKVNGTTVGGPITVNNGVADLSGLNIAVPVSNAGIYLDVVPTFGGVGINQPVSSGATTTIALTYLKSISGSVTTVNSTLNVGSGSTITLVSSKPTISIATPSNVTLTAGLVEVADVTVSADSNGSIGLAQLPIKISTGNIALGSTQLVVKVGGVQLSTNVLSAASSTLSSTSSNASGNITFNTDNNGQGYIISAGQSVTFQVFATLTGGGASGTTDSTVTSIGTNTSFKWIDINGNATHQLDGSAIYNYPTGQSYLSRSN